MTRYEIPLHGFDDGEKSGPYLIVEGRTLSLVDYSGEPPHDLVKLHRHQALALVRVLTTWLASETKVHNEFSEKYGDYKDE